MYSDYNIEEREKFNRALKNGNFFQITKIYNNNTFDTKISYDYALYLIHNKQYGNATKVLNTLIGTNKNTNALISLAKIALKDSKYEKAKRFLIQIIDESPKAKIMYAKIEIDCKNYDNAKKLFNELLNDSEYKNEAILELAKIERLLNNYDDARDLLNQLSRTNLRNTAIIEYGEIEESLGNFKNAKNIYKLVNNKELNDYAKLKIAKMCLNLGEFIEAEDLLNELINTKYKQDALTELIQLSIKNDDTESLEKYVIIAHKNKVILYKKLVFYIYNMLGVSYKYIKSSNPSYLCYQIADYDEYTASDYIKDRQGNLFNPDIDLVKLYTDIKDKLTYENISDEYRLEDVYNIPYENIGKENEDILKVYTLPNTNKVLYMQPHKNK